MSTLNNLVANPLIAPPGQSHFPKSSEVAEKSRRLFRAPSPRPLAGEGLGERASLRQDERHAAIPLSPALSPPAGRGSKASLPARPTLRLPRLADLGARLGKLGLAIVFPLALLALWQIATDRVWLPPQILPAPAFVWETLVDMLDSGEIASNLAASLQRVAWSILLGGSIGLSIGFAMGLSKTAKAYLYPSFSLFAQFPVIAWSPLMLIFFGIDEALKISTITVAVIVPFAVATYKGIENVPVKLMEVGRIYQFSFTQTLWRIALPAALPAVLGGVRQGCMQAWLALVFVELLASSEGIGYLLVYARNLMQLDVVIVCMAVIGLVGLVFDFALGFIERHFSRWAPKGR